MKILFVIPTIGNGGAERVLSILANSLCKKHKIKIIVIEKSTIRQYHLEHDVDVLELNFLTQRGKKIKAVLSYLCNFFMQRNRIQKEIKKYYPDVVVSFLPKADFLLYTIRTSKNFKWVSSERNDPTRRNYIERIILKTIYRNANALVCQTRKIAEYYRDNGVKNITIIRNPITIPDRIKDKSFEIKDYLIAVGRLDKQKNFDMLIKAFSRVVKRQKQCETKLLILGSGPDKEFLERIVSSEDMDGRILLLGRIENVFDYYSDAKAFVMSSNYEGMPNAMLEAMAMGLPVISTDYFSGAASELVDETNGFLVPVSNQLEMERAIDNIITMPREELMKMGICSRMKVTNMNSESIIDEWEKLLKNLTD